MIEVPVRHLNHSIVPVIIGSIVDAEDIINAMELRCFVLASARWLKASALHGIQDSEDSRDVAASSG